ncbi:MAG: phosphoenolpyruvate--protein phosphotransferase [Pseudomonadales bacterium]
MLEALQQLVLQIGEAENLNDALGTIVRGVRAAMQVDESVIYLVDPEDDKLVLVAAEGIDQPAIGTVRLALGEGLVGTIGQQRQPLVVADARNDPRFKYFPSTGEMRYHAFLGVPVVHYRKLVGALVVQSAGKRVFDDTDTAFLVTISAQLAGIVHGAALGEHMRATKQNLTQSQLQGIPGAPGVAVGTPLLPSSLADLSAIGDRTDVDCAIEEQNFLHAVSAVTDELLKGSERLSNVLPDDTRELFKAYVEIANDPHLAGAVLTRIRAGQWAPAALRDTVAELSQSFEAMADSRMRARGEDIRAVGRRLLRQLHPDVRDSSEYPDRCILVGREVSIARIAEVPRGRLAGIICFDGSVLSHTAVVAKSLGIPAVMGLGRLPQESFRSDLVILDGYQGTVIGNPLPAVLTQYRRLEREELDLASRLRREVSMPAKTTDGIEVSVGANITLLTDIDDVVRVGASGVGLYRTEFPFMLRQSFPGEDDQVDNYQRVLEAFAPAAVVMRTLDIGGDKPLPYFPFDDPNPSLGWRGIRVSLNHPEIFVTQIRAMLRADVGHGNLRVMLPMVSTIGEIDEARNLIEQACTDLSDEGFRITQPPIGVMIEVPALLFQISELAKRVDFFSIGTNDLTQYLMAADRDNPNVADLYDNLQPAVLLAIRQAIEDIHRLDGKVTVCGELASDPRGTILMLGMGVDALSVAKASISRVKWVIRHFATAQAAELTSTVLQQESAVEVKRLLEDALEKVGLGGLVRAGS